VTLRVSDPAVDWVYTISLKEWSPFCRKTETSQRAQHTALLLNRRKIKSTKKGRAPKDWSEREADGALELGLTRKRARTIKHERCSSNGADKAAAK
jgi:hypothetical protein